jgi:hypothetical protein
LSNILILNLYKKKNISKKEVTLMAEEIKEKKGEKAEKDG